MLNGEFLVAGAVKIACSRFAVMCSDVQLCHCLDCFFALIFTSELLGFCFSFSFPYLFVSGPCTRLSWPSCQILSAR